MPFLIIFIIIPLAELFVFGLVGDEIGLFNALLLALLTAVIGGAIVRHQGLQTLFAVQQTMRDGKMPLGELFDGICLVIAGATLITPGFITDTIGFLLLIPQFRRTLQEVIKKHTNWTIEGAAHHNANAGGSYRYSSRPSSRADDGVIDVEYEELSSETRLDKDKDE